MNTGTLTHSWKLTECRDDGQAARIVTLTETPTSIGRASEAGLSIASSSVSKRHAEIKLTSEGPLLTDLGSTNGTFVNGQRVSSQVLCDGDIVQFANAVFRTQSLQAVDDSATMEEGALPWAEALLEFEQLMRSGGVKPHFQPIVEIHSGETIGYESLARSELERLRNPSMMFSTAARLGQECALSVLMRREAGVHAMTMSRPQNLFLNTHPKEVVRPLLVDSLHDLRSEFPELEITIEIHESSVVARHEMLEFREVLRQLNMKLAYDDFGAGQARLDEIVEVPPDYLKFDIKLIRDIDQASEARVELVRSLVQVVNQIGIVSLAEGIETAEEAETCREIGFRLAQGYYYGRPAAAETFVDRA